MLQVGMMEVENYVSLKDEHSRALHETFSSIMVGLAKPSFPYSRFDFGSWLLTMPCSLITLLASVLTNN